MKVEDYEFFVEAMKEMEDYLFLKLPDIRDKRITITDIKVPEGNNAVRLEISTNNKVNFYANFIQNGSTTLFPISQKGTLSEINAVDTATILDIATILTGTVTHLAKFRVPIHSITYELGSSNKSVIINKSNIQGEYNISVGVDLWKMKGNKKK